MGGQGGISGQQKNLGAGTLANIARYGYDTSSGWSQGAQNAFAQAAPFYSQEAKQGLPFFNSLTDYSAGTNAQAFAPAYGQLARQYSQYSNLPSGSYNAARTNLGAQQARSFDSTMVQNLMANQMAKQQGAAGLTGLTQLASGNALGYLGQSGNAGQSLAYGQQRPSLAATLIGGAQGAAQTGANIADMAAAG